MVIEKKGLMLLVLSFFIDAIGTLLFYYNISHCLNYVKLKLIVCHPSEVSQFWPEQFASLQERGIEGELIGCSLVF